MGKTPLTTAQAAYRLSASALSTAHTEAARRVLVALTQEIRSAGIRAEGVEEALRTISDAITAHDDRTSEEYRELLFMLTREPEPDDAPHLVAQLLEDAQRMQQVEPNAGTAERIARARAFLEVSR